MAATKSSTRTTASGKTSVIPDLIGNLKTLKTMKKNILSALAICAALLGCQKNEISETRTSGVELHATIEDDASAKTVMDENNNIRWSEEDQVVAFMKTSLGLRYQIKKEYIGKTSGYFSQVSSGSSSDIGAGTEWDHNVVYYPYSDAVEAEKSGDDYALNVVLPSEQTYAAESFGNGAMAMVAVSESNNITFRNVLGGMKLQLKGIQKVATITLLGRNNEKLSGSAVVTAYAGDETKPSIAMSDGSSTSVTLNCGSGVQLNESKATEFIIALPPVLFSKGFTVTVTDDAGNEQTIETDKENAVLRSSLIIMPEVKLAQPGDYVDEYGVNHGQGTKIGETVWAPVNCGYHATDFKYGKLYQWGRKYGQGYEGKLYDINGKAAGDYSDATVPTIEEGGVSVIIGQHKNKENVFFTSTSEFYYDWLCAQDSKLWNSGSESAPMKTEYDPCPEGWRVPTYAELDELNNNYSSWTTDDNGRSGRWFSGPNSYTASVPQVFFPAAGSRYHYDGNAYYRGAYGDYWSSRPDRGDADRLSLDGSGVVMNNVIRANAYSVRCVLVTD